MLLYFNNVSLILPLIHLPEIHHKICFFQHIYLKWNNTRGYITDSVEPYFEHQALFGVDLNIEENSLL